MLDEAPHFAWDPQECVSDFPNRSLKSLSPSRSCMAFRSSSFTEHFAWEPQLLMPQHFTSPVFSSAALGVGALSPMLMPATAAIRRPVSCFFIAPPLSLSSPPNE